MSNYFIYGDDEYSISKQIKKITNELDNYDEIKLDMSDANIGNLLEELKTIPFLFDSKLLLISNISEIDTQSNYYNEFISTIAHPIENIVAIFLADSKLKMDSTLAKDLKKYTTSYSFSNDGSSLDKILDSVLKEEGFKMDSSAKDVLLQRVDNAMSLHKEIDKLMTYRYNEKNIYKEDVLLMVAKNLDTNVFDLINAVVENKKKDAIAIYRDLQVLNVMPTYLIGLLITKFQELMNVKVLIESGYSQDLIATVFNIKSGRAYYMMKNANTVSMSIIKEKLDALSKLEADIKMGKQDQHLGLELFLLK